MTRHMFYALMVMTVFHKSALGFIPVMDVASLKQNALVLAMSITNVKNQVQQMERELKWMADKVKSLKDLGFNDWHKIESHLRFLDDIGRHTDSLSYNYKNISSNVDRLYKNSGAPFGKRYEQWQEQKYKSIKKALVAHGVLQTSEAQMGNVSSLIKASRRSMNDKQVLETVAELNAIHAQQLDELKTIIVTDSRAKQSAMLQEISKERAMRDSDQQFMKNFGQKKKQKHLYKLPSLS